MGRLTAMSRDFIFLDLLTLLVKSLCSVVVKFNVGSIICRLYFYNFSLPLRSGKQHCFHISWIMLHYEILQFQELKPCLKFESLFILGSVLELESKLLNPLYKELFLHYCIFTSPFGEWLDLKIFQVSRIGGSV